MVVTAASCAPALTCSGRGRLIASVAKAISCAGFGTIQRRRPCPDTLPAAFTRWTAV